MNEEICKLSFKVYLKIIIISILLSIKFLNNLYKKFNSTISEYIYYN